MKKQSLPMIVRPVSCVPRCSVAYSRTVVRSPSSQVVGSFAYLRSCGAFPTTAPWWIRHSAPMPRAVGDEGVGRDGGPVADHHVLFDDGVGPDGHVPRPAGPWGERSRVGRSVVLMNVFHGSPAVVGVALRSMIEAIISASATSAPSTYAFPCIWQILLLRVTIVSSKTSWSPGNDRLAELGVVDGDEEHQLVAGILHAVQQQDARRSAPSPP